MNFDLLILPHVDAYHMRVVDSPAGQATGDFTLPFTQAELDQFAWRPGIGYRHLQPAEATNTAEKPLDPQKFGTRLFTAVFAGQVGKCLLRSLDAARREKDYLRVRLRLTEVPELAMLPWEYLYDSVRDQFFALLDQVALMRYMELPEPEEPLPVTSPLRILVMVSKPQDAQPLAVEQEWERLQHALQPLVNQNKVVLEKLEAATSSALQQQLRRNEYHIFHFIGHGWFDEKAETSGLLLEDELKKSSPLSARQLGVLLQGHQTLRFVFLNACEGARGLSGAAFGGTAQYLVRQRLPAVVAMQFPVSDQIAIRLSLEFYRAVADNYPIDRAVTEARKAVYATGSSMEWATPVLFMRSEGGRLFQVDLPTQNEPIHANLSEIRTKNSQSPFPALPQIPYFTGRQDLIDELTTLLTAGTPHFVVGLVGPGGIGKTAIASYLVHKLKKEFPDGILWADLDVSTPEAELISFATPFGQTEAVGKQLDLNNKAEVVRNILAEKSLLVVLNNAENREQVDLLIPGGSNNRTLITTRNRRMLSELEATMIDVTPRSEGEAILFLKKMVGNERIDDELEAAKSIIKRVGGLPLALSIVGGYLKELQEITLAQYDQLLQEKEWRREYLSIPGNDKRNVYKTFAISYDKLEPNLQHLFTSLAIFDGPDFGSDAVATINRIPVLRVMQDLSHLLSRSLLSVGLGERKSLIQLPLAAKGRYRLHPLIKSFAIDQLDNVDELRQQLALYYVNLAQRYGQPAGYKMLDLEWQNIILSLEWAYNHQKWATLMTGVIGLTRNYLGQMGFLDVRGYWNEARKILSWAHQGLDWNEDVLHKSQILTNLGGFAVRQTDYKTARVFLDRALDLLTQHPETLDILLQKLQIYELIARTLLSVNPKLEQQWIERGIREIGAYQAQVDSVELTHYKGYLHIQLSSALGRAGKFSQVITVAEEGLKLLETALPKAKLSGFLNLGNAYLRLARVDISNHYYHEGVKIAEAEGDTRRLAALWLGIGENEGRSGNLTSAITYFEKAISVYQQMGDVYHDSGLRINIAANYLRLGDEQKAHAHLEQARRLVETYKLTEIEALALSNLADLYIRKNEAVKAGELLTKAFTIADELKMSNLIPTLTRQQAEAALQQREFQTGLTLIEEAIRLVQENPDTDEESISWRVKGMILYALDEQERAMAAWQESLKPSGVDTYELAKNKLMIAEAILSKTSDPTFTNQARLWLEEALTAFNTLEAKREIHRIAELLNA